MNNINPRGSSSPSNFIEYDGELFFTAGDGQGVELFKTDGVTVTKVSEINDGSGTTVFGDFAEYNGRLYFAAGFKGAEFDMQLYAYDGLAVEKLFDINPFGDDEVDNLTVVSGVLYFTANPGGTGVELFRLTVVPEPSTLAALAIGMLTGGGRRRLRY